MTYSHQALRLVIIGGLTYVAVVIAAYFGQRRLLYFPTHLAVPSRLSSWYEGEQLFGCAREVAAPARVWLMLPGNGGQAANRDYILACVSDRDAVYVLEYPGYGFRPGSPSRGSIDEAAADAYRELRRRYPGVPIGAIGESLGSGAASFLGTLAPPPDQIVLLTPFDSLVSVAAEYKRFLPVRWLLKDRWDNVAALRGYKGPVTVYGAEDDRVIPVHHARALAAAIGARFILLPAGHNDWMGRGLVKLD